LSDSGKHFLLRLARETIGYYLENKEILRIDKDKIPLELNFKSGCFVTLKKEGDLRGCIGTFNFNEYIYNNVVLMSIEASFRDPRFPPLRKDELNSIDIEISVLTPMVKLSDFNEIEIGRDGLYVVMGYNSGVLLPQVAVENNWDRETFLSYTCLKAGLPADAWKKYGLNDPKFAIYKFSAIVFGE
ncbi:MAG: AmmeMemoRadiSam system protein A, partial [Deferribacterota bacterium]|nr:AmmeMemoRadiSam system protein A [Deferribacterota bacterium]